MNVIFHVM